MTDADPIFDLDRCAQALAHGHDPAEIAVHLQGIIERLRQVRSAEDERRDVLAHLRQRAKALTSTAVGRTRVEAHALHIRSDALSIVASVLQGGHHEGAADIDKGH